MTLTFGTHKAVDIDRAHRVGKPQNIESNNKNRSDTDETTPKGPLRGREIIVKFQSHHARMNLLKGRTNLRRAKVKMFINEDLTKSRKTLAYKCRQLKRDDKIKKTWVYGGNVFIQDLADTELCIKTESDLKPYMPEPLNHQPVPQQASGQAS